MRLDTLPDKLISISLSGGNANEIFTALNRLALPTLSEQVFGEMCAFLLEKLAEDTSLLSAINSLLWRIYYDGVHGLRPLEFEPLVGLYWFHEWENLIPDGYEEMTMEELRQQVTEFLKVYAAQV